MPLTRFAPWTLLAGAGFALLASSPATGLQDKKDLPPGRPGNYTAVAGFKDALSIPPEKMAAAKAAFKPFAQYFADYISYPRVYSAPTEFRPEVVPLGTPPPPATLDELNVELARHIHVPVPVPIVGVTRPGSDQADYIRELGAALDAALIKVIKDDPTPVVRINATRLLATAAKSGAAAHYATITDLVANPNYPLEVKNYAYQAAANLLAAYDLNDYRSRNHSSNDKAVAPLVKALQDAIFAPPQLETERKAGAKPTEPNPDQLAVTAYLRRAAVRALAQVRFSLIDDKSGTVLYPAHTLARVAMGDPALVPPPRADEAAEAVIGLCNMAPRKGFNADLAADAVGTGLHRFAEPRAGNPLDRTIAWRVYAARLADSMKTWRGMYDPGYDPAKPNVVNANNVPKSVELVSSNALSKLLLPMDKVGPDGRPDVTAKVDLNGMIDVMNQLRAMPNRPTTLFRDVPETALGPAPVKQ